MSAGAWFMAGVILLTLATLVFLVGSLLRSIQNERTPGRSVWREFGLGLVLMILFLVTWIAHAVSEWQVFTDEQTAHGETPGIGDFVAEFSKATLENWQSEFLQLFTFVVLAALYVHKGSAESKDGDENVEASLRRIEQHLGTLPSDGGDEEPWKLPDTSMRAHDDPHHV